MGRLVRISAETISWPAAVTLAGTAKLKKAF